MKMKANGGQLGGGRGWVGGVRSSLWRETLKHMIVKQVAKQRTKETASITKF